VTIDDLLAVCATRTPTTSEIERCSETTRLELKAVLNLAALTVARRYASGQIDFSIGDEIMNSLHSWSTLHGTGLLPDPAHQVFEAFDEGEYRHKDDSSETDIEAKYTRPMIDAVLRGNDAV
jgi:hypothetical protein